MGDNATASQCVSGRGRETPALSLSKTTGLIATAIVLRLNKSLSG